MISSVVRAVLVDTLVVALLVSMVGCGVQPSGVQDGGVAPTGVAGRTTLFFVDEDGELRASERSTGRLGTVQGAVRLLMAGASSAESEAGLRTEVPSSTIGASVNDAGDSVTIRLPFSGEEIGAAGVDQVICTVSAVVAGSGRDLDEVRIAIQRTDGDPITRPCPALD